jgi:hypothetical protein
MSAPTCSNLDHRNRTCIQAMANGWSTPSDLCPGCTVRFMAALDALGEPLDWHPGFVERGTTHA